MPTNYSAADASIESTLSHADIKNSTVLARLVEEVLQEQPDAPALLAYDRMHNRHNRP